MCAKVLVLHHQFPLLLLLLLLLYKILVLLLMLKGELLLPLHQDQ